MTDTRYNGWTNYATWRVNLEICDEHAQYLAESRETFSSMSDLAQAFEDAVEEAITKDGMIEDGLALDYARAFLSDVDWWDIAEHHAADLPLIESDDDDTEEEGA